MSIITMMMNIFSKANSSEKSMADIYKDEKETRNLLHQLPEHERIHVIKFIESNYPKGSDFNEAIANETAKILKKSESSN
mgnify:FL=1|jgi:hypothetical protein